MVKWLLFSPIFHMRLFSSSERLDELALGHAAGVVQSQDSHPHSSESKFQDFNHCALLSGKQTNFRLWRAKVSQSIWIPHQPSQRTQPRYHWADQSSGFVRGTQENLGQYQWQLCPCRAFLWKALSWRAVCIFFFCQAGRTTVLQHSLPTQWEVKQPQVQLSRASHCLQLAELTPGLQHVFFIKALLNPAFLLESPFSIFVAAAVILASPSL